MYLRPNSHPHTNLVYGVVAKFMKTCIAKSLETHSVKLLVPPEYSYICFSYWIVVYLWFYKGFTERRSISLSNLHFWCVHLHATDVWVDLVDGASYVWTTVLWYWSGFHTVSVFPHSYFTSVPIPISPWSPFLSRPLLLPYLAAEGSYSYASSIVLC